MPKPLPDLPEAGVNNVWHVHNESDTVFVFVHGVLSDSRSAWLNDNDVYWPNLVTSDPTFEGPSIFLGGYYTEPGSGSFGIRAAAGDLYRRLSTVIKPAEEPVLAKNRVLFIGHSTGGIVVRHMLVSEAESFKNKIVGLMLIASPSVGSHDATRLGWLAKLARNKMGTQLQWHDPFLEELDKNFKNLVYNRTIPCLRGVEALENHLIVSKWFGRLRDEVLVEAASAGRYFGEPVLLAATDHFTAVKPADDTHPVHVLLRDFYSKDFDLASSMIDPGAPTIVDIAVNQNRKSKTCVLDFFVRNPGESPVSITTVRFEVVDTARGELVKAPLVAFGEFDLDLSELREPGQSASCLIAHEVASGTHRFTVTLTAERLGTGVFAAWILRPTLVTDHGDIPGRKVEVWLPFKDGSFEALKAVDSAERASGGRRLRDHAAEGKTQPRPGKTGHLTGERSPREHGARDQDPFDKSLAALEEAGDFGAFASAFGKLRSEYDDKPAFDEILRSKFFVELVREQIRKSRGVASMTGFLSTLAEVDKSVATIILTHRGYFLAVLPQRLDEEPDIEEIGLCLELLGKCSRVSLEILWNSGEFDEAGFVEKINREQDLYKIGHAIERIWREDEILAKRIVESELFDSDAFVHKLKTEKDPSKVSMGIGGIESASPATARKLRAAAGLT